MRVALANCLFSISENRQESFKFYNFFRLTCIGHRLLLFISIKSTSSFMNSMTQARGMWVWYLVPVQLEKNMVFSNFLKISKPCSMQWHHFFFFLKVVRTCVTIAPPVSLSLLNFQAVLTKLFWKGKGGLVFELQRQDTGFFYMDFQEKPLCHFWSFAVTAEQFRAAAQSSH